MKRIHVILSIPKKIILKIQCFFFFDDDINKLAKGGEFLKLRGFMKSPGVTATLE